MTPLLKAPFPYFGGKSRIASLVWSRFGDVRNLVDPFCGSLALLLGVPADSRRMETVNDKDGLLANFWRATHADPDAVAQWADWPVNENDLHARQAWLVGQKDSLQARLEGDPDFYDVKAAGWWVWGICCWIGGGWCSGDGPWMVVDGELIKGQSEGQGITRQIPYLSSGGHGINRRRPHLSSGQGIQARRAADLSGYFQALADRLRRVRVCCGDWRRVLTPAVTTWHGLTAVFLDPPYSQAERDSGLYRVDEDCAVAVREWAITNGDNPLLRIALCGYQSEHEMPPTWEVVRWKAHGGYGVQGNGRGRANRDRETVWFSPACLKPE